MTIRDDIVARLSGMPAGLTDGEIAASLGKLHSQVNQRCRQLEREGYVRRDRTTGAIRNILISVPTSPTPAPPTALGANVYFQDPRWEGNVQAALVSHLQSDGWHIVSCADTASQAQGIDIVAEHGANQLLVEVKGYPGTVYARGPKAGQAKPTAPTLQAKHWLSDAVLKTLRTHEKYPNAIAAMGFPDMPRYRSLLTEISASLTTLNVTVFLVQIDGSVTTWKDA